MSIQLNDLRLYHQEISEMRSAGKSYRDISKQLFNVIDNFSTIRNYCVKHGISKGDRFSGINVKNVDSSNSNHLLPFEQPNVVVQPKSDYVPRKPNILIIDIETSPHVSFHFGVRKQFIRPKQIIKQQVILTVSMKWVGEDEKHVLRLDDYDGSITTVDGYVSKHLCDKKLLMDLWHYLDQADVIVAHNGSRFDNGWMRQRMLVHGIPLPSPYKIVDTLKVLRKELALPQNTLEAAAEFFDLNIKKKDIDLSCWIDCMNGKEEAFDEMVAYNIDDIDVLELLYLLLRCIDSTHPNMSVITGQTHACTHCGAVESTEVHKNYFTSANAFSLFRCTNCGGYFRSRRTLTRGLTESRNL